MKSLYNTLNKHGQLVAFGLGALIVFIFLAIALSGLGKLGANPTMEELYPLGIFDFGILGAKWLAIFAAIAAIGLEFYSMATNPKGAIPMIGGLVIIAIVFFIGYSMSSGDVTDTMKEFNVGSGTGKMIGGAIWTAVAMVLGAVGLMIVSELRGLFK